MQPNPPEPVPPEIVGADARPRGGSDADVGAFRPGNENSRYALSRYLVGRAIGESLSRGLLLIGLIVLVGAGLLEWAGHPFWAIFVALLAIGVLGMRALLTAVLTRVTVLPLAADGAARVKALVADTRTDVLRELRRIGLPGRTWSVPLLALRFIRPSRNRETVEALRGFQVERAVPAARLDELHLIVSAAARDGRLG